MGINSNQRLMLFGRTGIQLSSVGETNFRTRYLPLKETDCLPLGWIRCQPRIEDSSLIRKIYLSILFESIASNHSSMTLVGAEQVLEPRSPGHGRPPSSHPRTLSISASFYESLFDSSMFLDREQAQARAEPKAESYVHISFFHCLFWTKSKQRKSMNCGCRGG